MSQNTMTIQTFPIHGTAFVNRTESRTYTIDGDRPLGEGEFGIVYAVTEQPGGRKCALKLFNRMHRGRNEAKRDAVSEIYYLKEVHELQHPYVIEYVANFEHPVFGDFVVTYPRCRESLERRLERPMDYSTALRYFREVSEALQAVHSGKIFYGDLAPRNILITYDDHVRLTDFGVCLNAFHTAGVSQ